MSEPEFVCDRQDCGHTGTPMTYPLRNHGDVRGNSSGGFLLPSSLRVRVWLVAFQGVALGFALGFIARGWWSG